MPLLSLHRSTHSVKHFKVDIHKRMIVFGQEKFSNVEEFIEHFDNRPLIGDDTGIIILCENVNCLMSDSMGYFVHTIANNMP